jgi:metallo-beta-lactamase family protein
LEANDSRFLIDCGLYQERALLGRNWEPFPVPPGSIDAVILTHAHVDHCGFLPKLVHDGFKGKVYCTEASFEIAKIVLLDSAHLQMEDAEFKKRRHQKENRKAKHPEIPLYTTEDAENSFPLFKPVKYEESTTIGKGIIIDFHDAGHVLGSSMVRITITQNRESRTIVFSGDVGRWDQPILNDPHVFTQVDYVLVESTYGDRVHEITPDLSDALVEIINSTKQSGGNIIIPVFALQRSQEILYYLDKLLIENRIPHLLVFLDSPMAAKITEVFKHSLKLFDKEMRRMMTTGRSPFEFPGLKMVETTDESKSINYIKGTVIVMAGSGMCNGGRIKHHLVTNISRPESTILFVGYQAAGTLGREITDGAKRVRILGQFYDVKARIAQLSGFSAHADRNELLRWLSSIKNTPRQIFVVHGEPEASRSFSEFLTEKTGWHVTVPEYEDEVILH